MITTCRYCGSKNITTLGGEDGDPFNRCPAPMSVVCCDCGRTINSDIGIKDLLKKVDESDKMKDGD